MWPWSSVVRLPLESKASVELPAAVSSFCLPNVLLTALPPSVVVDEKLPSGSSDQVMEWLALEIVSWLAFSVPRAKATN